MSKHFETTLPNHWLLENMQKNGIIDEIDKQILKLILPNSRESITSIAEQVGKSRVTIHDRINKMMEQGLIKSFNTQLNFNKAGFTIKSYILVSFDARIAGPEFKQKAVAKLISKIDFVRKVSIITGSYDFLVEVVIDHMHTLAEIIIEQMRDIPGVSQTQTMIMFDEYRDGFREY